MLVTRLGCAGQRDPAQDPGLPSVLVPGRQAGEADRFAAASADVGFEREEGFGPVPVSGRREPHSRSSGTRGRRAHGRRPVGSACGAPRPGRRTPRSAGQGRSCATSTRRTSSASKASASRLRPITLDRLRPPRRQRTRHTTLLQSNQRENWPLPGRGTSTRDPDRVPVSYLCARAGDATHRPWPRS